MIKKLAKQCIDGASFLEEYFKEDYEDRISHYPIEDSVEIAVKDKDLEDIKSLLNQTTRNNLNRKFFYWLDSDEKTVLAEMLQEK